MYYNVGLMDTSYNRDLKPGLKQACTARPSGSASSKRSSTGPPRSRDHNPKGLPERTILEATLPEFGPVTFPAYASADARARMEMRSVSMTDEYNLAEALDQFIEEPDEAARPSGAARHSAARKGRRTPDRRSRPRALRRGEPQ